MRLEKHRFLDTLSRMGSSLACPFCACESWQLLIESPVKIDDQRLMEFSVLHQHGRVAVSVVVMLCEGCGHVRLQSTEKALASAAHA